MFQLNANFVTFSDHASKYHAHLKKDVDRLLVFVDITNLHYK